MSIILDDSGTKEPDESAKSQRQSQLDVLPTPSNLNSKQAPMVCIPNRISFMRMSVFALMF